MNKIELIESAKAYVALSNAHQIDIIRVMFAEDAIYGSTSVGEFEGEAAIIGMMSGFFERFPDVFWQVDEYKLCPDSCTVGFGFTLSATDKDNLDKIERKGLETIRFNEQSKIVRIEVRS